MWWATSGIVSIVQPAPEAVLCGFAPGASVEPAFSARHWRACLKTRAPIGACAFKRARLKARAPEGARASRFRGGTHAGTKICVSFLISRSSFYCSRQEIAGFCSSFFNKPIWLKCKFLFKTYYCIHLQHLEV